MKMNPNLMGKKVRLTFDAIIGYPGGAVSDVELCGQTVKIHNDTLVKAMSIIKPHEGPDSVFCTDKDGVDHVVAIEKPAEQLFEKVMTTGPKTSSIGYQTYDVRIYTNGDKHWYKNGRIHREDGPAIEYTDGNKGWYRDGKIHREDGPAMEYTDGNKVWYRDGKIHREDGPAVEYANGAKIWFINGYQYTEEEFNKKKNSVKEMTVAEISALVGFTVKIVE